MARAPGLPLTTSARLVAPVVMYAAERGMALPELLEELSVGPDVLFHADATVPTETLGRAWRTVAAAFPNEPVGLAVAQTIPLSSLGPLVHVAQHSSTRREALDAYLRFLPLLTPALSVSLEDTGQETAFALSHDFDDADGGHATECALLLSARVGAQLAGDTILRVTLPWASHGPVDAYPAAFGAPVRFGARASAVWLSAEALALPPTRPDPFLFEHVTRHLEEVRRRLLVDVGPLQTVMAAITDCANRSEYGHVAIAKELGLGVRTLQRRIAEHGTTLRALVERVREANAVAFLDNPALSIDEVAILLGYTHERAFRRAFERWQGQSPAAFRRARSP